MIIYYITLLVMTFLGSVASLFLKKATEAGGYILMLKSRDLYIGGFLYLASAVLNILVLKVLDYSVVLPLTSLTYIWTMILSDLILKEDISKKKIIGVFLIVLGALCVSI